MAKQTKLGIKNIQLANVVKLESLKEKLGTKSTTKKNTKTTEKKKKTTTKTTKTANTKKESTVQKPSTDKKESTVKKPSTDKKESTAKKPSTDKKETTVKKPSTDKKETTVKKPSTDKKESTVKKPSTDKKENTIKTTASKKQTANKQKSLPPKTQKIAPIQKKKTPPPKPLPNIQTSKSSVIIPHKLGPRLGPTGKHINDLLPQKKAPLPPKKETPLPSNEKKNEPKEKGVQKEDPNSKVPPSEKSTEYNKKTRIKEFRDVKPLKHKSKSGRKGKGNATQKTTLDPWTKKRLQEEEEAKTIRPSNIKIRLPISLKELASEMKIKASQIISKLFLQGMVLTLNSSLDDETTAQLIGEEFDVTVEIDQSEDKRLRITDLSVQEEIEKSPQDKLISRPPVVTFMGHVDHGKTSLIDFIRKSHVASGEAGAITQHIGAFSVTTDFGSLTFLDTPGHEAFTAMRARGANVTDITILVIAGDEGIKQQTIEAIQHAKAADATILVAINKCDKSNFNAEDIYRQLSEQDLLPEAWGGTTITVNCSAKTGEGINTLLEMITLQAEILELKANPDVRARGRVLESEMHKGMGSVATLLVQNGTLKKGDALVFDLHWGRVKTMKSQDGSSLLTAGPSIPLEITGLSGLPEAGYEFIVVSTEKEARTIAEGRMQEHREKHMQKSKSLSLEGLLKNVETQNKKTLNILLRADVQGSLEALKASIEKDHSEKISANIIFSGIGEISESDVELAAASNAIIIGFHTNVESHAESLIKQLGVRIELYDIIYHAIDALKEIMKGSLDQVAEEVNKGEAEIKTVFKASHLGKIAGCFINEGTITRNHLARIQRSDEIIWKGSIASIKRNKDDVKEIQKGFECGILLNNCPDIQEGDIIQSYEIIYHAQEL